MIKKLMMLFVSAMAAILSYGSLLSEWYADHHDNPLEEITVGSEKVKTKDIAGGFYRFQTANAELVNTTYGWKLVLGHGVIVGNGIYARGDLIIELKAGERTEIRPTKKDVNFGTYWAHGDLYGVWSLESILIYGAGELTVFHHASNDSHSEIGLGSGIGSGGTELKITGGSLIRVETLYAEAVTCGNLSVINAVLETSGNVYARGSIQIDHSVVNIMSQSRGLEGRRGRLSIIDSCCTVIAKSEALSICGLLTVDDSIVYAYSENKDCVVSNYDAYHTLGNGCVFGKGFYRFATNGGKDYAAIDSSSDYSSVIVNGATIETCAPGGTGINMTLPRLTMNSGLIRHRNSMDFKKDFLVGRELLDAYGLLISWNSVGIELGYSPEKVIGVFLGETLVNWLQKQSIDNPKGKSLRNIRGKITLNDGTIISEESENGIYGDDLWGGVIHIIKGGSLQGPIWPVPVDANGNELACVTNVISTGTAYEQVTSGWTAKLPKDYNTTSLVVDGEKKLYFWVPPDIGFYKPDEWSSPFFVTSDPDGTKPMSRINLGDPVYLKYSFKNLAGHAAMKGFFNSFTLNGETSFTNVWEYSTLKAGEWGWGGAYWRPTELQNLPQGTYTLKCELDVTDVLKNEASEQDNSRTITFTIGSTSCTVTFNPNGGIVSPTTRTVAKGATVGTLPTPRYSGYIFDGWYTASSGGTKISSSSIITQNITLYAHWKRDIKPDLEISSVTVSKSIMSISESVTIRATVKNKGAGSSASSQVRFSWPGGYQYVFCPSLVSGGSCLVSCTISGSSMGSGIHEIVVSADGKDVVSESNEYNNDRSARVVVNNPSASKDFAFNKLDYTEPDSFYLSKTKEGKVSCVEFDEKDSIFIKFSFWDAKRNFTANEVHAKIELDEDTWYSWKWDWFSGIVYHNYAPDILQNLSPGNYKVKVTLDYKNWWDEICETNNVREISFVVKGESEYTIKFHGDMASGSSEIARRYTYGVSTALPSASALGWTRNGAVFKGWATSAANAAAGKVWKKGGAIVAKPVAAGETLNVYAVWDDTYTIRFIRNEGSGYVSNKTFKYGTKTRIPSLNSLGWARRGYTFKGWATSTANARNGKIWKKDWAYVSTATTAGKTLTVYAVWSLKSGYYAIRFNKNDGTGKWRELGYKYGDNTTLPTIANGLQWSRSGYKFGGWATSAANAANGIAWRGDKGVTRTPVAAGKTLNVYAIWKKTGAAATAVNRTFAQSTADLSSLPSFGAAEPTKLLPGYYSGELADGTGTYDLLVDEGGETGYVNIVFDDGSAVSVEVEVDFLDDIILVIDEAEEQYPLMR